MHYQQVGMAPPLDELNVPPLVILRPLHFNPLKNKWHFHFPDKKLHSLRFVCQFPEMPHLAGKKPHKIEIPGSIVKSYGVYFKWSLKSMCAALSAVPKPIMPDACRELLQELAAVLHTDPINLLTVIKKGPAEINDMIENKFKETILTDVAGGPETLNERIITIAGNQLEQLKGLFNSIGCLFS